ncbi:MAG: hypothetical protein JXQ87_03030 [Bacteroidia bacterium]
MNFSGKIKAFEFLNSVSYSVLTKQGQIHTESWMIDTKNEFRFPLVRRIDHDSVLVVNTRSDENEKNAWIYNRNEELVKSFTIGDAVNDIVVFNRKFVVSYFDEGIMAQKEYSKEGLAIFNKDGKMKWGFNSNTEFEILDCYQIVKSDWNKVIFFGYGKFPICELNIDFLTIKELQIPIDIFVESISYSKNKLYWKNSKEVFCFNFDNNEFQKIREFEKKDNRRLIGNSLLNLTKNGYELEKINAQPQQQS